MATPVTGDIKDLVSKQKEGVTLHNMPNVALANLADATAVVNDKAQSGKRLGALIVGVDTTPTTGYTALFAASGPEPTDTWVMVAKLGGDAAGADVTPA